MDEMYYSLLRSPPPVDPAAEQELLHRFKHWIIMSDVIFNGRWSDVNSSDLRSLNTDMLGVVSSRRFDVASASETGGGRFFMGSGTRSMSEITNVSRFQTARVSTANVEVKERREWLQMVKSTVQWFAGRERRVQSQHRREDIIV